MECSKCDREAVMHAAYSGAHLCETHFRESVERRVRNRIREDDLLPASATPADPVTWVVGLSGGKDSTVLTRILAETFDADPRVELIALSIHEGIEDYRDESLEAAREVATTHDVEHVTVTYEDEYGVRMDEVAAEDPLDMAPCAYCGVFRRDALSQYASDLDADVLLTGHNLDDEAETALMNVLEGDVAQMAKHFDASLGPLPERTEQPSFVPRAKPLRDVPEKEVALYAHLFSVPSHVEECPHAAASFRGEIQDLLLSLEESHPGTRHSIIAGYEDLARMAAERYRGEGSPELEPCTSCGSPTTGDRCRKCQLLDAMGSVSAT
ncbi:MAG: TIGR00269 family protein [Halanaeroarchaeum sp.]